MSSGTEATKFCDYKTTLLHEFKDTTHLSVRLNLGSIEPLLEKTFIPDAAEDCQCLLCKKMIRTMSGTMIYLVMSANMLM